jgi:hypoxanthine phosphoribosyltransferase
LTVHTELKRTVPTPLISAEKIAARVRELGRQITHDNRGHMLHVLAVLDNSFVFVADLIRVLDLPVICEFIKPLYRDRQTGRTVTKEIFFSPEIEVRGHDVLLVEGVLHSGVTTDFLVSGLLARGASSVKIATLIERQSARRVALQPDYFGFQVEDNFLVGYGLGSPLLERNLPFVAIAELNQRR